MRSDDNLLEGDDLPGVMKDDFFLLKKKGKVFTAICKMFVTISIYFVCTIKWT